MEKFKNACKKIASVMEWIIGIALAVCLFAGGLGFIGYVAAFCIGGETATAICTWLYKVYYVWLIKIGTVSTVAIFLMLYLRGDAKWVNPVKYWKNRREEKKEKRENA